MCIVIPFQLEWQTRSCLLWLGRDCSDIKDSLVSVVPKIPSGIYIVHPENTDSSFEVHYSFIHSQSVTHSSVTTQHKTCPAGFLWNGLYGRWMDGDAEEDRWINWLQTTLGRLRWWIWKSCRLHEAVQWQKHVLCYKSFTSTRWRLGC